MAVPRATEYTAQLWCSLLSINNKDWREQITLALLPPLPCLCCHIIHAVVNSAPDFSTSLNPHKPHAFSNKLYPLCYVWFHQNILFLISFTRLVCSTVLDQLFRRLRSVGYGRLQHDRLDYGINNQIYKLFILTKSINVCWLVCQPRIIKGREEGNAYLILIILHIMYWSWCTFLLNESHNFNSEFLSKQIACTGIKFLLYSLWHVYELLYLALCKIIIVVQTQNNMTSSTLCAVYLGDMIWGLPCTLNVYRRNKEIKLYIYYFFVDYETCHWPKQSDYREGHG